MLLWRVGVVEQSTIVTRIAKLLIGRNLTKRNVVNLLKI